MNDSPRLNQGDKVVLPTDRSTIFQYPQDYFLNVTMNGGGRITVSCYDRNQTFSQTIEHDLSQAMLTIGKGDQNTMILTRAPKGISHNQASIELDKSSGQIIYTHLGRNEIRNPLHKEVRCKPLVDRGQVVIAAGSFTTENKKPENIRTSNEDRVGAFHASEKSPSEVTAYLYEILRTAIKGVNGKMGDSTLSLATHTNDGGYACAYLGDSPFYLGRVDIHLSHK